MALSSGVALSPTSKVVAPRGKSNVISQRFMLKCSSYGYVDFESGADCAKAHDGRKGTELDGRPLNVDFANQRPSNDQRQEKRRQTFGDTPSEPSDTLFVGNLSFDIDADAVTEQFQPFGTITGVRLPTKPEDGSFKGFGYVTFASVEEATAAFEGSQGGYLGGRPMRLDYSQPRPPREGGGFGGRGGRGGGRGGGFDRGGRGGGRGRGGFDRGRGGRGGRGGGRGSFQSTNRGGFNDFKGNKVSFD
jgi:nucleolin